MLPYLRRGVRSLGRSRGFAAAVVLTLGTAIALSISAFAVLRGYLLHGLPYPAAERLYSVRYSDPGQDQPRNMEALDWASLGDVIEHPIAWDLDVFYLLGGDHAESMPGAWVTRGFVDGLGITPAVGRGFDADAFADGGPNVALISHRLWHARFGGDPEIAGRTFTAYVSDRPDEAERYVITGVLPADFWHINPYTDVLVPLRAPTYPYVVRLRPDVAPEQAAARISALVRGGADRVPQGWAATLVSTHAGYVASLRPILQAVSGAALLVLLVACANVAGLMLVRAIRRRQEIAIHVALGAGRGAIARMIFGEALVLGAAASVVALALADVALGAAGPLVQAQLGRPAPAGGAFGADAGLALAAMALGLVAALGCTLVTLPGWIGSGALAAGSSPSRTMTAGRRSARIRSGLVTVQIAASLALLAGTSLMLRSVTSLLHLDLGFDAAHVLNASVTLRQSRYPDAAAQAAAFGRIDARLRAIPGVESVALTTVWPVQQPRQYDVSAGPGQPSTRAGLHIVNDAYFSTLRIPLVAGRAFAAGDAPAAEPVAIVSDSLARRLWSAGGVLGSRIAVPEPRPGGEPALVLRVVVGIVADVRQGPGDEDLADVYLPIAQRPGRVAFVMARTSGTPGEWSAPVRAAFRDVDPEIAVDRATPLQTIVDRLSAGPQFLAVLIGVFSAAAMLLALVGTYSVIAYAVRQREREIAVRLAVGADPRQITRLFVREGAVLLALGVSLGLAGALAGGRLIESQLVGVTPRDPAALAGAAGLFAVAGLVAIWWPSRRAARTDPAVALRAE